MQLHAPRQRTDPNTNELAADQVVLTYALDMRPAVIDDDVPASDKSPLTVRIEFLDMDGRQASSVAVRVDLGRNSKNGMIVSKVSVEPAPDRESTRPVKLHQTLCQSERMEVDRPYRFLRPRPPPQSRTYRMSDGKLLLWRRPKQEQALGLAKDQPSDSWLPHFELTALPSFLAAVGLTVGFVIGFVIALVGRAVTTCPREEACQYSLGDGKRTSTKRRSITKASRHLQSELAVKSLTSIEEGRSDNKTLDA